MSILSRSLKAVNTAAGWADLPPDILQRLAAEGIRSAEEWRRLSRAKRRSIFGITPSVVKTLDAAAQERL